MTHATNNVLSAGQDIGGSYRLEEVLARGGFGVVWGAQHLRTGQSLAVKVLDADRAALRPGSIERFMREAQTTAALRHPNTIRVFDVGGGESALEPIYLVMERLYGPTLEQILHSLYSHEMTMSEVTAIDLAIPILDSLAEAHDAGLVHRDLKPGNIMLNEVPGAAPMVKVLDFGCTYVRGSQLTADGNVFGTPGYMSPEQIVGDPLDARTDLYALGLILYRCITGRPPFMSDQNLALLYQYTSQDIPDPQQYCDREISRPLVDALLKSVARNRNERFDDATQMRAALQQARDAVRASARRVSAGRNTMVSGSIPAKTASGLEALVRIVTEETASPMWNKLRTESDMSGQRPARTAEFVGEVAVRNAHTEATSKAVSQKVAQLAENARRDLQDEQKSEPPAVPSIEEAAPATGMMSASAPTSASATTSAGAPELRSEDSVENTARGAATTNYSAGALFHDGGGMRLEILPETKTTVVRDSEPPPPEAVEAVADKFDEPQEETPSDGATAAALMTETAPQQRPQDGDEQRSTMPLWLMAALLAIVAGGGLWLSRDNGGDATKLPVVAASGLTSKKATPVAPNPALTVRPEAALVPVTVTAAAGAKAAEPAATDAKAAVPAAAGAKAAEPAAAGAKAAEPAAAGAKAAEPSAAKPAEKPAAKPTTTKPVVATAPTPRPTKRRARRKPKPARAPALAPKLLDD